MKNLTVVALILVVYVACAYAAAADGTHVTDVNEADIQVFWPHRIPDPLRLREPRPEITVPGWLQPEKPATTEEDIRPIEFAENNNHQQDQEQSKKKSRATAKRRSRRNKLKALRAGTFIALVNNNNNVNDRQGNPQITVGAVKRTEETVAREKTTAARKTIEKSVNEELTIAAIKTTTNTVTDEITAAAIKKTVLTATKEVSDEKDSQVITKVEEYKDMADNKSRDEVLAARQAKKLAKQKGKDPAQVKEKPAEVKKVEPKQEVAPKVAEVKDQQPKQDPKLNSPKSKDEVDKACVKVDSVAIDDNVNKDQVKAERAARKAAKQAHKKKDAGEGEGPKAEKPVIKQSQEVSKPVNEDMTVKDVVETLRDIATVARNIKDVTEKVNAIDLGGKKPQKQAEAVKEMSEDGGKSKAELRAERRAKQEAQRAAKQAALEKKEAAKPKEAPKATPDRDTPTKDEKATKQRTLEKKPKPSSNRVNWFQHLYKEHDKESLKTLAINSHLHPAIIKLGVQLASRVVSGSNARCVALLDALKKMVRDYTLPAKTEFARGLESHLASSLEYLWAMRAPSASQTNAVKFFRYHLTQLPNNVAEFDAKKTLQEEIDRYIREQIDMAGEAISIAVRNKISNGDNILTYGCSSLIERILKEAWSAGVQFRTVVVGNRVHSAATQLLRRLVAHGLPCTYADITSLSCVMSTVDKVILGAGALLVNGSVLGALGSAQVALAARARNVPLLVACETHKFCERVQTDAFVYNEIGDPDDLIDKSDENSPLKDWRSNQNLTPLNLTYDVTPASLVTAVVTELAILPCTSAPVVLRFKLSEYSV